MGLLHTRFTCVDPGQWPERRGAGRVLVEHPDHAHLAGAEEVLAEAGYDVAVCAGPNGGGQRCPLVEFGRCALAEGADVVVVSTDLPGSDELIDAHERYTWASVVIETSTTEEDELAAAVIGDAVVVRAPITPRALLAAVHRAAGQVRIPN